MIKAIVCTDEKWAIGKDNDLLFHLPADMAAFRMETTNKIVVFGYNTLLSFPGSKPLKHRSTICLCPEGVERDDCFCIHDFDIAVQLVSELAKTKNVYVIGGAMLYKSMLPYYDEVLVTKVDADGAAEVFFPNLDECPEFTARRVSSCEDMGYDTSFWKYTRK
jgi:dihydrofolate reductase